VDTASVIAKAGQTPDEGLPSVVREGTQISSFLRASSMRNLRRCLSGRRMATETDEKYVRGGDQRVDNTSQAQETALADY